MRHRSANKVLPERAGLGASARAGPGSTMQWRRVGQRDVDESKEPCYGLSRRTRAATWRSLEFLNWSLWNSDAVDLATTHKAHLSCHHRDNDSMAARSHCHHPLRFFRTPTFLPYLGICPIPYSAALTTGDIPLWVDESWESPAIELVQDLRLPQVSPCRASSF